MPQRNVDCCPRKRSVGLKLTTAGFEGQSRCKYSLVTISAFAVAMFGLRREAQHHDTNTTRRNFYLFNLLSVFTTTYATLYRYVQYSFPHTVFWICRENELVLHRSILVFYHRCTNRKKCFQSTPATHHLIFHVVIAVFLCSCRDQSILRTDR